MSVTVLLAPASAGKTAWSAAYARERAAGLASAPLIAVPARLQAQDLTRRLASSGGALGVSVATVNDLASRVLVEAGIYPARLTETAQTYLARSTVADLKLDYYSSIRDKPGFIRVALDTIRELKAGGIDPGEFSVAAREIGGGLRLGELAEIYAAYQQKLIQNNWSDPAGEIWMAARQLEKSSGLKGPWNPVIFDGFDDFTPLQLRLIFALEKSGLEIFITLTGAEESSRADRIHKRFRILLDKISREPDVSIKPLSDIFPQQPDDSAAGRLRDLLFKAGRVDPVEPGGAIVMAAVPDREAEIRAAMRWIKSLARGNQAQLGRTAIIMRNLEPYRPIIERVSREYGLPARIIGGLPLQENPAVNALLKALRLAAAGREGLHWQDVVSLWRSPYFDWRVLYHNTPEDFSPEGHLEYSTLLSKIARWGRVIQGYDQWKEAFELLDGGFGQPGNPAQEIRPDLGLNDPGWASGALWELFCNFVSLLTPPEGSQPVETLVAWVEDLMDCAGLEDPDSNGGLGIIPGIIEGPTEFFERDWRATQELKRILREQLWSSNLIMESPLAFKDFLADLEEIISRRSYQPLDGDREAITCGDPAEIRGLSFEAVAVIGIAEGEFPGVIKEDPFLRDRERGALKQTYGLPLQLSSESAEEELFYESVARATSYLMFTRPRIADNGASWLASPFWDEVQRCLAVIPRMDTSRSLPPPGQAGSLAEFLVVIAADPGHHQQGWQWIADENPGLYQNVQLAETIFNSRASRGENHSALFDGGLDGQRSFFENRYPLEKVWSASRLETYQSCPYYFFISNALNLEQAEPPGVGLNARQLGNIYHHILENLYCDAEPGEDTRDLLARLPDTARQVFGQAPEREGFRETAWWRHTQQEILDNLRRTIIVLEDMDPEFKFFRAEQKFGIPGSPEPALSIAVGDQGSYRLRGFIDRVDLNSEGKIRIVDYKTSSPAGFDNGAVRQGKKLQLPLYALAAQQALQLGNVEEGFYFHVRSAQPSSFRMASYQESGRKGPGAAIESAVKHGWNAIQSIRQGRFRPQPPQNGCPDYCPAAEFCWHYQPGQW